MARVHSSVMILYSQWCIRFQSTCGCLFFLIDWAVGWKSGVAEIGVGSDLLVSVLGKAMA